MAMMTGRVLLVCALCVLWCGAGGRCDEEGTAGSGIGGRPPPESKQLETSPEGPQGLKVEVPGGEENVTPASSPPTEEKDDDENDGEENDEGAERKAEEEKGTERQSVQEGTVAIGSGSGEKNLGGSRLEKNQAIVSAEGISHSGSQESDANSTQTEFEGKKDADENTPAAEITLTTGNGENTVPGGIAGVNRPSPPEEGVDSREQDSEDTTSEGEKNVQSPETAATPQSHRNKGSEGTGEDTKATTVTANTTDTTNTQNSDSSTVVSHTTSPLLLLLFVACAAAAAVVAA
ncbi:Mucin-associated surface protein (MASP), subgroup S017 [Trypanosoma cruzi]|nr:Mucin-associated surface protein (MASP), subgroup S017 [Trypanosoma cruzi]